jgi:hypothetical protein
MNLLFIQKLNLKMTQQLSIIFLNNTIKHTSITTLKEFTQNKNAILYK